jgi:hypothetical protein
VILTVPVVVAVVTVSAAVPLTPLTVAVIVVEPAATPVARPPVLIGAVAVFEELHVADEVTFAVDPLL